MMIILKDMKLIVSAVRLIKSNWLDKYAKEAEVTISDDEFSLTCFSHPF